MTREKKELFAGIAVVITVYIATLWQRPLFAPGEFDFAVDSMSGQPDLMSYLNSFAGKFLKYNLVSIRLLPALSAILTALCLKKITGRFISSIIFLATPLAFIFSTAASPEMINTFFLTCGTQPFCR